MQRLKPVLRVFLSYISHPSSPFNRLNFGVGDELQSRVLMEQSGASFSYVLLILPALIDPTHGASSCAKSDGTAQVSSLVPSTSTQGS